MKKWSAAQRAKFKATIAARKRNGSEKVEKLAKYLQSGRKPRLVRMPRYVYVLRGGQFLKVRLQRVRAVTFGEIS